MRTFVHALFLMLVMSGYGFARACMYYGELSPLMMNAATVLRETCGVCFTPLAIMYLNRLRPDSKFHLSHLSWILLPIIIMTGSIILIDLYNQAPDNPVLHNAYVFWTDELHKVVLGVSLVILLGYVIYYNNRYEMRLKHIWYFMKGTAPIRPGAILGILLLVILGTTVLKTPWDVFPASVAMVITGFMMLFGSAEEIVRKDLGNVMRYNTKKNTGPTEAATALMKGNYRALGENSGEDDEDAAMFAGAFINSVARAWDEDSLLSKFQHLMLDDQIFLQPRVTLGDVAEILHTNKTYISKMVNNIYKCGFPEVINTLRVDYAEQYILRHRNAKQDEIAKECGFLSASSFNNTFKKIAGMPPKQWVAGWDAKHGNI